VNAAEYTRRSNSKEEVLLAEEQNSFVVYNILRDFLPI
jgi:hypothetical protein